MIARWDNSRRHVLTYATHSTYNVSLTFSQTRGLFLKTTVRSVKSSAEIFCGLELKKWSKHGDNFNFTAISTLFLSLRGALGTQFGQNEPTDELYSDSGNALPIVHLLVPGAHHLFHAVFVRFAGTRSHALRTNAEACRHGSGFGLNDIRTTLIWFT